MYTMLRALASGGIFLFLILSSPIVKAHPEQSPSHRDTASHPMGDPDRWWPVTAASAKTLASQQGENWKKIARDKNFLIGLGTEGPVKLKELLASDDPITKIAYTLVIRTADSILKTPLPRYRTQAEQMSRGMTAVTASVDSWLRPVADEVVVLTVAVRVTGNANYKQRLHDLVMNLCAFPAWGSPPLNADLVAGHVSRAVAFTWNWTPELWTGNDRKVIVDTVRKRVNAVCKAVYGGPGGYWAGMYTGNHNQVTTAGVGIAGAAFLNDIPEATEWLAAAWLNFQQVAKWSYADGASPEGTAYLTYGVSFTLQFIEGVNGLLPSRSLYDAPFLRNMANYRVANTLPGFHGIIGWGDSYPVDFSGPEHILLRLSSQYNNALYRYAAEHIYPGCGGYDDVKVWTWLWSQPHVASKAPTQLDYHAPVYDIVNTRSGWTADDYVLSFKSGFNNRSHSHLDAGAFSLAVGDNWLLPAAGYGKGTGHQDFWDKTRGRWQYLSNVTESNSTLLINNTQQRSDNDARSTIDHFESYADALLAECDMTNSYSNAENVRRRIFHKRGEYFIVYDNVQLKSPGKIEWLLQTPANGVINDNTVNVQGPGASVNVTMLTPNVALAQRQPQSANPDLGAIRKTISASSTGKEATFVSVIEPSVSAHEKAERTFTLTADGAVEVKTADTAERIYFSVTAASLSDKSSRTDATARMLYVKASHDKAATVVVTDATQLSTGILQLTSDAKFSAEVTKKSGNGWELEVSSGKGIRCKGATIIDADSQKQVSSVSGPGRYKLQL